MVLAKLDIQPHRNEIRSLSLTLHKNQLKVNQRPLKKKKQKQKTGVLKLLKEKTTRDSYKHKLSEPYPSITEHTPQNMQVRVLKIKKPYKRTYQQAGEMA